MVIGCICIILAVIDVAKIPPAPGGIRCRGLITDVDNSQVKVNLIVKTNMQFLKVKLLDGPHRDHEKIGRAHV